MPDQPSTTSLYLPDNVKSDAMKKLGEKLSATFQTYEKDRKALELQWLKNLRQFRGIYDPEIESRIPDDQSTAYPKITRNKVIGTTARLMEMLYPRTDKNYEVTCSPLPTLSEGDLQLVLDKLVEENPGVDLTNQQIEDAIRSFAEAKAKRLDKEIKDQLDELDIVSLAKKVVFSGVLYGPGVLKGPMVRKEQGRTWTKGPDDRYRAVSIEVKKPFFEVTSVWDWFPDLSAKSLTATDFDFQRHIMTRTQFQKLRERPDFIASQITEYLRVHKEGNFKERHWERELRARRSDKENVTSIDGRKYELIEAWGRITGHQLKACGVNVPEKDLSEEIEVNVWMIDGTIIKAVYNPYDGRTRGFHVFVYEEDDINLTGNGLPVVMRDSQMAICEAARMVLDNGSVVCGPQLEVHVNRLMPGTDLDVYARKVWPREDEGPGADSPAVRELNVNAHITELLSIIELFERFADTETALPPSALGDVSGQGKESLRTTGNLSMLLGAAALPIRDTVRNYDRFTVSFIEALCYWNMDFNPNPDIKGDFKVIARGSTSLIAKEVRAQALMQLGATLTPDEKMYLSTKKMLLEKLRVLDLPDELLEEDSKVQAKLDEQARIAQQQAQDQQLLLREQVRAAVAEAFKNLMLGLKAQAGANSDTFNTLVEGIINVRESQNNPGGRSDASQGASRSTERAGVAGAG